MRRLVSVWLPRLATDRLAPNRPLPDRPVTAAAWDRARPLATASLGGRRQLLAINRAAQVAGLRPGMTVADARAVTPALQLAPSDPAADRALLERLAEACLCYTPWVAVDGWAGDLLPGGGLLLDITGCAHLQGGEAALLSELTGRLHRFGLAARAAVADTLGAAWAWARFGAADRPCLPPGGLPAALAGLPVAALRLEPAVTEQLLRLGLATVGQVAALPRPGLAGRFGTALGQRLDQALGRAEEPLSPRRPVDALQVHARFAEPIARTEDVEAALRHLLGRLEGLLEGRQRGVRRLELVAQRVDASFQRLAIGTSRPSRDPRHLFRLLAEPLGRLDAGFGIETLRLLAAESEPLDPAQGGLAGTGGGEAAADLAPLLDALGNRLGFERVVRLLPRQSHLPERAVRRVMAEGKASQADAAWPPLSRPVRLFARPEPVEAVAPVPDAPPLSFRWRRNTHRIRRAEGPERISPEWWRAHAGAPMPDRDYYRVEDETGRRYWLYREGLYGGEHPPRWYLHGLFP